MVEHTIEVMRELLRENVLEIEFEKADGSRRKMIATTNPMYIPDYDPTAKPNNPWSDEVLRAIDVELGEWRSFRFDSLRTFAITDKPVLRESPEVLA